MFSGNGKVIIFLLSIICGLFVISKLKVFIRFISWSVIIFCLGIMYIKANSKNQELQDKIDYYFRKIMSSKFVKFIINLRDKFSQPRKK